MTATVSVSWAIALTWAALTGTPERDLRQVHCMAQNAWFEAGDLTDAELIYHVVMNRAQHEQWPDDPCRVILQRHQFTWTSDRLKLQRGPQPRTREEARYFSNLLSLAWNTLKAEQIYNITNYHTYAVRPRWPGVCPALYGEHHVFYRPCAEPSADAAPPSVSPGAGAGVTARGSLTPRGAPVAPPFPQRKPGRP